MGLSGINLIPKALRPAPPSLGNVGYAPPHQPSLNEILDYLASIAPPPPEDPGYGPDYGGGDYYDTSGGGGDTVIYQMGPQLPPYDPNNDPSYQALLAQLGLNEAQARNATDVQKQQIAQQAATAVPRIKEAGIEQRRGLNIGAEQHGMFRSGARLRELSLQQRGEQQRLADNYTTLANRNASLDLGLQGKLNDLASQKVQAAFEAKLRAGT